MAELTADFGPGRILAFQGDHGRADVIATTLASIREQWGEIDCLVANIGSGRGKAGLDLEDADWQGPFEVNLWSSVRVVSAVVRQMIERRQGSITIVGSVAGFESLAAPLAYSAAKAALINYSKNLSRLVGAYNVRVNCVAPGNILFPGGSWEQHLSERTQEVTAYIRTEVPLQRFGRPDEIAGLIVFLSSELASFITGACIIADGGQTRGI
jgi:3-oxoacyl-[acyl-carrier protein] reductase